MTLVSETLEGLKGRLEAWKGAFESKGLRVKVKTKMIIGSESTGKVIMQAKFPRAASRKRVGSNSILCQLSRCWVHKRWSGIRSKLKEDRKFKISDMCKSTHRCSGRLPKHIIKWLVSWNCGKVLLCLWHNRSQKGCIWQWVTRISSGWCRFRDVMGLLASTGLALEAKGRSYSAFCYMEMRLGQLKREMWSG